MYYNEAQRNFYNPTSRTQNQRDFYGPNPMNEAQFNNLGRGYNSAQADFYNLPKVDFNPYKEDFFKRNNMF